jgi:type I restriction enzyme, S subunit
MMDSRYLNRQLKYVATINDETLSEDISPDFSLQYIDIGNVDSTGRINEVTSYLFSDAPSRARRKVKHGDVIVSTVRTYLQAIAPIEFPPGNLIVSTGFAVVRPNLKNLDTNFCKYALRESRFLHEVITRSVGVSYPAINASDLGNIFIPTPPLLDQKTIASYLDQETAKIDSMISAKERLLVLLTEKRQALITHAVTRGLNPNVPLRDSGIDWLGEIPEHWEVEQIKYHISKIEQGWSPQSDNFPANENEWGVMKVGAVNGWEFDPNENKRLPEELDPLPEYEIKAGDILISRANTTELLGSAALVGQVRPKLLLCDKLYRLTIHSERLCSDYLVYYLRSLTGRFVFERDATGASNSMQNISQESVTNLPIPIPPVDEQIEIVSYVKIHRNLLESLESRTKASINLLQERRTALISAAVTGQINIPQEKLYATK